MGEGRDGGGRDGGRERKMGKNITRSWITYMYIPPRK